MTLWGMTHYPLCATFRDETIVENKSCIHYLAGFILKITLPCENDTRLYLTKY